MSGVRMKGYLPRYYETSRVMDGILQAQGAELDLLRVSLEETLAQFFVGSATWGLDVWEAELGIAPVPGKPDDQRRSVINAKLRGVGTVTVELIESVASAYSRGTVEVTQQPAAYQFTVRFVDTLGTPPNLGDLKAAIDEIKPAHLQVVYQYKYFLLNQLHQTMTINQIQTRKMTDFAPFIPV
ncbi:YmfQ family protein [Paenibacillus alba]|uniref:YmfQ family protein n=2 Tax=Paenibacillus alba TaxID=1197127 RepID=A0ABU6G1M3_9BACL|nr:YmfQ family protein [Paenibacillus alba]MEC0228068.1 YmfQ family protein [Paenibacillus alba]NQX66814.1 YmfQ family protein [Paenibacillus alba]